MITKSELFSDWLTRFKTEAATLNLPLSFAGADANTGLPFIEDANEPYLKADLLWGAETRPYLKGSYGQQHISIVQIAAVYPKAQQYASLKTAEAIHLAIPLDTVIGAPVYNSEISPPVYTEERVMHVVSFTLFVV